MSGQPNHSKAKESKVEILPKDSNELKRSLHILTQNDIHKASKGDECTLKSFKDIITGPVADQIIESLNDMGIQHPTRIQYKTIPIMNDKKNSLLSQSQSSSGKTLAYLISMLYHIDPTIKSPQAVCICLTKELVLQTYNIFTQLNSHLKYKGSICLNNYEQPTQDTQILFGTPTSINYVIQNAIIFTSKINFIVIDDADVILSKNGHFNTQTTKLFNYLPKKAQYCFFATTISIKLMNEISKNYKNIITQKIKHNKICLSNIEHWYTIVPNLNEGKNTILELIKNVEKGQVLIFTKSNANANEINNFLKSNKINCESFSSDELKDQRESILNSFRNGDLNVLISTDILARGIDVPNISLVINVEIPIKFITLKCKKKEIKKTAPDCDLYVNRAGRTGRFGRFGICFSILLDKKDEEVLHKFCSNRVLDIPLAFIEKEKISNLSKIDVKSDQNEIDFSSSIKSVDLFEYVDDDDDEFGNMDDDSDSFDFDDNDDDSDFDE